MWLNIYSPQDFVSFVAGRIFGGQAGITDVAIELAVPFPQSHCAYWHDDHLPGHLRRVAGGRSMSDAAGMGARRRHRPLRLPAAAPARGAVGDAIAAVRWLLSLGVPAGQILLHASPTQASEQPLKDLLTEMQRPSYLAATEPAIWASIDQLRNGSGSRLFRLPRGPWAVRPRDPPDVPHAGGRCRRRVGELGLDEYLELFLSMDYPTQFVFLDGCQNYLYADLDPADGQGRDACRRHRLHGPPRQSHGGLLRRIAGPAGGRDRGSGRSCGGCSPRSTRKTRSCARWTSTSPAAGGPSTSGR